MSTCLERDSSNLGHAYHSNAIDACHAVLGSVSLVIIRFRHGQDGQEQDLDECFCVKTSA